MEVHRVLGMGFLESVYEEAFAQELDSIEIPYQRQVPLDVIYKGKKAKQFIADFFVNQEIMVELKAIKTLTDNENAQLLNYLKAGGVKVGLIFNFGASSLEYKRLIF